MKVRNRLEFQTLCSTSGAVSALVDVFFFMYHGVGNVAGAHHEKCRICDLDPSLFLFLDDDRASHCLPATGAVYPAQPNRGQRLGVSECLQVAGGGRRLLDGWLLKSR